MPTPPVCDKCEERPAFVNCTGKYCHACNMRAVNIAFGKAAGLKDGALKDHRTVAVAVSLGHASLLLAHLAAGFLAGKKAARGAPRFDSFRFVHVDERAVVDAAEPLDVDAAQRALVAAVGADGKTVPDEIEQKLHIVPLPDDVVAMARGDGSLTARLDAVRSARLRVLLAWARENGCTALLVGDPLDRTAEAILEDTCHGRGRSLHQIASPADDCDGVRLVRPLCHSMRKPITFYAHALGIRPIVAPGLTTRTRFNASIQQLVESLLADLSVKTRSTVSTVVRTASKLAPAEDGGPSCAYCMRAVPSPTRLCHGCQLTTRELMRNEISDFLL